MVATAVTLNDLLVFYHIHLFRISDNSRWKNVLLFVSGIWKGKDNGYPAEVTRLKCEQCALLLSIEVNASIFMHVCLSAIRLQHPLWQLGLW